MILLYKTVYFYTDNKHNKSRYPKITAYCLKLLWKVFISWNIPHHHTAYYYYGYFGNVEKGMVVA